LTDAQGKKCDFRESVIILTSNLGSGGGAVKPFIGFVAGDQPVISPDQANERREDEAIRKHLRPELVNRLTKVVHFKPLGMETAREVLGKLMEDFNKRLADKGIKVELTASAEELILREGYSEQYGARNLERAVDRLLGTLIAEALLSGKIAAGETFRLEGKDGRMSLVGQ
jgi:ATP-dependent Clp protease ATP-binding subunit ClpC